MLFDCQNKLFVLYYTFFMNKNIKNNIKLELLSPAKDLECGKLAILSGADAVYIGGPDFSARAAAGNRWDDIQELVEFAHGYYARVYLALNTILFDNELSAAKKSIEKAYEIGVDAVIIQDLGILKMDLPPIRLFASTQTNNYELNRLKFLSEAGLERIILARELSLKEISDIGKELPRSVELESFVHGALCVSLSGQCYFSQAISGRSANRGRCQQICRLPFDLIDGDGKVLVKDKYLLSLKDLNLSGHLKELAEAGVTSFKIEGRLKDASYVGNVTAYYRRKLDELIDGSCGKYDRSSSGRIELNYEPDLNKTFNRGYTEYFFNDRQEQVISPNNQKSLGEMIGVVDSVEGSYFTIGDKNDLKNGDGICWLTAQGELVGTNINTVKEGRIYPNHSIPFKGAEIYRNQNSTFERAVVSGADRRVAIDWAIGESGSGFRIGVKDEDGNCTAIDFEHKKILAEKEDVAIDNWRKQLSKIGETIFYVRNIDFKWHKPFFVPLSMLNQWRRRAVDELLSVRAKNYPFKRRAAHEKNKKIIDNEIIDSSYNVSNRLAEDFYKESGAKSIEPAFEKRGDVPNECLMTTKHCLKHWLGACSKGGNELKFKEPLYLVRDGKKYELSFDCRDCKMKINK